MVIKDRRTLPPPRPVRMTLRRSIAALSPFVLHDSPPNSGRRQRCHWRRERCIPGSEEFTGSASAMTGIRLGRLPKAKETLATLPTRGFYCSLRGMIEPDIRRRSTPSRSWTRNVEPGQRGAGKALPRILAPEPTTCDGVAKATMSAGLHPGSGQFSACSNEDCERLRSVSR